MADGAVVRTALFSARRRSARLDGLALTVDGLAPIEPGAHLVEVGGVRRQINLLPGEIVVLADVGEPRAQGETARPRPDRDLATPGWVLLASGGAGFVAAAIIRGAHTNTLQAYANADSGATLRAAGATARSETTAMNVLLVAGSAAIVTGAILLLLD